MCNSCNSNNSSNSYSYNVSNSCSCPPLINPCDLQIDASQVLYHKSNGEISGLTNLNLSNGSTSELIFETIDVKIKPLTNILSTTLTYLRTKYVINDLSQFLIAVSTELGLLNGAVSTGNVWTTVSRPTTPVEGTDGYNLTLHQREYWNSTAWISY